MTLKERLNEAMKEAMKAKDSLRLSTIRSVRSAIKNQEIDVRQELDDAGVIDILSSLVKQRKESAQVFRENERLELAEKEEAELIILQEFLPVQLTDAELQALVDAAIAEVGATSPRDMGRVMKVVTGQTKGRADGRLVSELVKERLAG
jgi:uncharacterized protein